MIAYVYVVVRADLTKEQQAVQAVHAALMAGASFGEPAAAAHVVLATVPGLDELERLRQELSLEGVEHRVFYEPDEDVGHSALATAPQPARAPARKLFKKLPLVVLA